MRLRRSSGNGFSRQSSSEWPSTYSITMKRYSPVAFDDSSVHAISSARGAFRQEGGKRLARSNEFGEPFVARERFEDMYFVEGLPPVERVRDVDYLDGADGRNSVFAVCHQGLMDHAKCSLAYSSADVHSSTC